MGPKAGVIYRAMPDDGKVSPTLGYDGQPRFGWPVRKPFPRSYYSELEKIAVEYWYPKPKKLEFSWILNLCHTPDVFDSALNELARLKKETDCTIFNEPAAVCRTAPDILSHLAGGIGNLVSPRMNSILTGDYGSISDMLDAFGLKAPFEIFSLNRPNRVATITSGGESEMRMAANAMRGNKKAYAREISASETQQVHTKIAKIAVSDQEVIPMRSGPERIGKNSEFLGVENERAEIERLSTNSEVARICRSLHEAVGLDFLIVELALPEDQPPILQTLTADFDFHGPDAAFLSENIDLARRLLISHRDAVVRKIRQRN